MNPQMKQRIDEKLDQLSDQHGAQILDFAELRRSGFNPTFLTKSG